MAYDVGAHWRPLLERSSASRALAVVEAIAGDLRALPPERLRGASLADGCAGIALLFAYLHRLQPDRGHGDMADALLDTAVAAVAESVMEPSLYDGFVGVAWVAEHLRPPGREDPDEEIDGALLGLLGSAPWQRAYDLVEGLVGLGAYALERLSGPTGARMLERVVDWLSELARPLPSGLGWWTDPAWLRPSLRAEHPDGYFNLGVAHGVPGVAGILGAACAQGIAVAKARPLLDGAVAWLLSQEPPGDEGGFPSWTKPGGVRGPVARTAWCYGDPGIAAMLLHVARALGEPDWESRALAMALRTARRPPEQTRVVDTCLCHGTAGLGHLLNRMFQLTGEPLLADAARSWFERTLAFQRPGEGLGGFRTCAPGADGQLAWCEDPGLITGAAGTALALLAASTDLEPAWDRVLLASFPERNRDAK